MPPDSAGLSHLPPGLGLPSPSEAQLILGRWSWGGPRPPTPGVGAFQLLAHTRCTSFLPCAELLRGPEGSNILPRSLPNNW